MTDFRYTIEDIQRATQLRRKLIDRCFRAMPAILGKYRRKLDGNKWWYDHGAMEIFQQVAVMKGNGKIFPEIKRWLENEFGTPESNGEQGSEVLPSTPESKREATPDHTTLFISTLKESQQRELETKDQMITLLTGNLKLLEEGRERRQQREDNLRDKVNGLSSQITTEREKRRQRKTLYAKLANLNGWSQRKERTRVLKQIEELDA